jgi:hypothetical protein
VAQLLSVRHLRHVTRIAHKFWFWTLVVAVKAIAIGLFFDSILWVSGHKRYTILFERVFDTPESAASRMRGIQGVTACIFGFVCIGGLVLLERRAARRQISDETPKGDSKHDA